MPKGVYSRMAKADRFWSMVEKHSADECWTWKAGLNNNGYGRFWADNRAWVAHRMAWMLANSKEVPPGMLVCHSCDNPLCCNPNHLWLGTDLDNTRDCHDKNRHPNDNRTHCAEGHELGGENLYIKPKSGQKCCRICRKAEAKRYRSLKP